MADEAAIKLGEKLNRLISNEDFLPILDFLDGRLSDLESSRDAQASITDCNPVIISHLSQRIDELISFREWIYEAIETGGREKLKKAQADEEKNLSTLRV